MPIMGDASTTDTGIPPHDSAMPPGDGLFDETPQCPEGAGTASLLKIEGELDGFTVKYRQDAVSSDIPFGGNALSTTDVEGDTIVSYVYLTFAGGLQPGVSLPLTGSYLAIPEEFSGGAGPYCVTAGEIGSVPVSRQPKTGATIHFRVTSVRKRTLGNADGVCTGPEIPASIGGCIYRTNSYLGL